MHNIENFLAIDVGSTDRQQANAATLTAYLRELYAKGKKFYCSDVNAIVEHHDMYPRSIAAYISAAANSRADTIYVESSTADDGKFAIMMFGMSAIIFNDRNDKRWFTEYNLYVGPTPGDELLRFADAENIKADIVCMKMGRIFGLSFAKDENTERRTLLLRDRRLVRLLAAAWKFADTAARPAPMMQR